MSTNTGARPAYLSADLLPTDANIFGVCSCAAPESIVLPPALLSTAIVLLAARASGLLKERQCVSTAGMASTGQPQVPLQPIAWTAPLTASLLQAAQPTLPASAIRAITEIRLHAWYSSLLLLFHVLFPLLISFFLKHALMRIGPQSRVLNYFL